MSRRRVTATAILALWIVAYVRAVALPAARAETHGFAAYYTAGRILKHSPQDMGHVYDEDWFVAKVRNAGIEGVYDIFNIQPPTMGLMMLPLVGLSPAAARMAWTFLSLLLLLGGLLLLASALHIPWHWGLLAFPISLLYSPVTDNLRVGQAYLALFFLVCLVFWAGLRDRNVVAGCTLGLGAVLKTMTLWLWPLLLLTGRWRVIVWAGVLVTVMACSTLPWIGIAPWREYVSLLPDLTTTPKRYVTAYQTLNSLTGHLLIYDARWNPTPVLDWPVLGRVLALAVTTMSFALTIYWGRLADARRSSQVLVLALFLSLAVTIAPVAEGHHYVLVLPALVVAWWRAWRTRPGWKALTVLGVTTILLSAALPYKANRLSVGWMAVLAYPRVYGAFLLWFWLGWALRSQKKQHDPLPRWLNWIALDRATVLGVLARVWGLVTGPLTALLIASHLSPEVQGYYYTFGSLLALQIFVELGLGTVIIPFASHEWSRLDVGAKGEIVGDTDALARLSSLAMGASRWYAAAALLAVIGLSVVGWMFFSRQSQVGVNWQGPWLALCLFTGARLLLVPIWSLLEGCNQVAQTYAFRLVQSVLRSVTVWVALAFGALLWTGPTATAVTLIWAALFLSWRYRSFIRSLFSPPLGPRIDWRREILPMQWRIAVSWLSGYLVFSIFTPVLFHFHGAVVAGQVGITWSLINAIAMAAFIFVSTKVPRFGILISQRAYDKLDRLFFRSMLSALLAVILGTGGILLGLAALNALEHPLADRFLPLAPAVLFALAMILNQIMFAFGAYLRSHKQEPFMAIMVIRAALATVLTVILGSRYGAIGVAAGFLALSAATLIPAWLTFVRCRAAWHTQSDASVPI